MDQTGQPRPIGFEMANVDAQDGLAPAPFQQNIYPTVPPDAASPSQIHPIGFEAHGGQSNAGYSNDENRSTFAVADIKQTRGGPEVVGHRTVIDVTASDNGTRTEVTAEKPKTKEEHEYTEDATGSMTLLPIEEMTDVSMTEEDKAALLNAQKEQFNEQPQTEEETAYFRDKKRRIDYALAFCEGKGDQEPKKKEKRRLFEQNLIEEGLELEYEDKAVSQDGKTNFVKIHAPWEVLIKYAEIMNMKMPIKENDMEDVSSPLFTCPTPFDLDTDILKPDKDYFTAPFNRKRMNLFIIEDQDSFFTTAQRSRIVHEVLKRAVFEPASKKQTKKFEDDEFGIGKLLNSSVYTAAFPLHEQWKCESNSGKKGRYKSEHSILTRGKDNDRHLLYEVWAAPKNWYKFQPLDVIRKYYGEKIGIYFYWLGFYTTMLFPAAIVGVIVFLYGAISLSSDVPSGEICDENGVGNITMCPTCDKRCSYWKLERSCTYSRVTYLFDNAATVFFAAFMALWATFFHEIWKRKQAEIGYDWDVNDFEDEEETVRPEFEASVKYKYVNPVNKQEEPFLPFWNKAIRYGATFFVLIFMICVVLAAVVGVIVYRTVIVIVFYTVDDETIRAQAKLAASGTAALINLIIIIIFNRIYMRVAQFLTNLEQPRTETEWEDSFTFKMFLFQFVNYYSSIFYIAFFKGRFTGYPGSYDYSFLGVRGEECDPSGCLIELCMQLGIIMIGKQTMNNFLEIILPKIIVWCKSRNAETSEDNVYTRYEQDYNLVDPPYLGLFSEYLEMVIQFGFVSIFVAAFPLAPLFALLNNIIEIRLDAYKYTCQFRRPLAARAQDLGVWFGILRGITAIAIISNACIIAFTSEFVPKQVYRYGYSETGTLDGYMNFSLSYFDTSDYNNKSKPDPTNKDMADFPNVEVCRYRGYRNPPHDYTFSPAFWHIMTARVAFIIVFENAVVFFTWLIMYMIPDIPRHVKLMMLRETYLSKEALFISDKKDENDREQVAAANQV